jgi:uncharacterized protein YkwD
MKKTFVLLIAIVLIMTGYCFDVNASQKIRVIIDNRYITFDEDPRIEDGRTIVPVRGIFESINASVMWFEDTRMVVINSGNTEIYLQIDNKNAYVNQTRVELEVPARIISGRTFVPIRFISESIGANVGWDGNTRTVIINTKGQKPHDPVKTPTPNQPVETPSPADTVHDITGDFNGNIDILMGASEKSIKRIFGEPDRIDLSRHGFDWYIYNSDLEKYIQVGIDNGRVVGLYTNSLSYKLNSNIGIGASKSQVEKDLGNTITSILKGNTEYIMVKNDEYQLFNVDNMYYATVFYDIVDGVNTTAFLLIDYNTEQALKGHYAEPSEELLRSYEMEIFDLANSIRVRHGKEPFKWSGEVAAVARAHSIDMIQNDFFSHNNLSGQTPFDRMKNAGISFFTAGENIARGQMDGIFAHEAWMNSPGHRKNIMGYCEYLGVGVFANGKNTICYTQDFFSPW